MTWQLHFTANHEQTSECCLALHHIQKHTPLRSWFGPMAQHLFQYSQQHLQPVRALGAGQHSQRFAIGKQLAQHLLIQASFFYQRCLHQYQVNDDIKNKGLDNNHDLFELLLFIRMSTQHPSQQTLQVFFNSQLSCCTDFDAEINTLLNAKLIQKICYHNLVFYDKNPYPHDHLLDLQTKQLKDFIHSETNLEQQQLLICQVP